MALIKDEILLRVYVVFIGIILFALLILGNAVKISIFEGEKWIAKADSLYIELREVEAERGNILSDDGSLLATSLPYYDIRMDLKTESLTEKIFKRNLDTLAYCLATYVDNSYTVGGYRQRLIEARINGERYFKIKDNVSHAEMLRISQFPIFNLGKYKGGFIAEYKSKRKRPFGILGHRTIGYVREDIQPVGVEGAFDETLGGTKGKKLMQKVLSKGSPIWIPINDVTQIEPEHGKDIKTTIDINLQDITERALLRGLEKTQADYGTAIVMEVKTGAIKAIANVNRTEDGGWWETYNHAIGTSMEPGSTFKLATMMSLLEDGYIDLDDSIDLEKGSIRLFEEKIKIEDASFHNKDTVTIRDAFEMSSNVAMAKLALKYYGDTEKKRAKKFIDRLEQFNLHQPTGIEIAGEVEPYIKEAYNYAEDDWSGTTIPWMSMGYELQLTPLQLLAFYNAVANDGKYMKPYLIAEIQEYGETLKEIKPIVMKKQIASKQTIAKAKELLIGVVENGTASGLKSSAFSFAGKTGTAQINYAQLTPGAKMKYQASFAGFFPADNPQYTCIVVVNNPQGQIYGSQVAGPIFRDIADDCFASKVALHKPINKEASPFLREFQLPDLEAGDTKDLEKLMNYFGLAYQNDAKQWGIVRAQGDSLVIQQRTLSQTTVPNVIGMGLKDALYILENRGLKITISGYGRVVKQSILPNTKISGQTIHLTLD